MPTWSTSLLQGITDWAHRLPCTSCIHYYLSSKNQVKWHLINSHPSLKTTGYTYMLKTSIGTARIWESIRAVPIVYLLRTYEGLGAWLSICPVISLFQCLKTCILLLFSQYVCSMKDFAFFCIFGEGRNIFHQWFFQQCAH